MTMFSNVKQESQIKFTLMEPHFSLDATFIQWDEYFSCLSDRVGSSADQ